MSDLLIGPNALLSQLTPADQASKVQSAKDSSDNFREDRLKEACQGFEAIFLNTLLKSMRATLPENTFLEGSHGQKMYQAMYDEYLAEEISKGEKSIGLKELLYEQLKHSL